MYNGESDSVSAVYSSCISMTYPGRWNFKGGGEDRPVKSNRELVRSTPANEKEIEKVQCVVCPESDVF